jgi:glutathione S-transferase
MSSIGKLYYTPTSCGAASYIAAKISGVAFDHEQVNIGTHKTASGADFYVINPHGNVPTLVLPNGVVLNEGSAVLQFIADAAPSSGLAPALGTVQRYQLINWLNYIGTEIHKSYGPLFNPANSADVKQWAATNLNTKLDRLNGELKGKSYVQGDKFTIADSYLYIVLSWSPYVGVDLTNFANLQKYFDGIKALPTVQAAHKEIAGNKAA